MLADETETKELVFHSDLSNFRAGDLVQEFVQQEAMRLLRDVFAATEPSTQVGCYRPGDISLLTSDAGHEENHCLRCLRSRCSCNQRGPLHCCRIRQQIFQYLLEYVNSGIFFYFAVIIEYCDDVSLDLLRMPAAEQRFIGHDIQTLGASVKCIGRHLTWAPRARKLEASRTYNNTN